MNSLALEIALVVVLILVGGTFNAAEISMISLRDSQVRRLAATRGKRGQRLERLVSDPNRFLASVQIGVTFATMLSSAFGAATIADRASGWLIESGMTPGAAGPVALIGVTLILAFFSLVLGELTPKRLGLQRSESIALIAAGPLSVLARLFRPVVWLLGRCTNLVVRLLGGDPSAKGEVISEEELQSLVGAHESLTTVERRVIADVFAAEDTRVREVMVARPDVEFLQASLSVSRAARQALLHPHSRFPVIGSDVDDVLGVVHIRDLLAPSHPLGRAATVADVAVAVTVIPGTKRVLDALSEMRRRGEHLAVVVDEYGGTDGIVTLEDLIEEIVGEMRDVDGAAAQAQGVLAGGSAQADGRLNLDDFAEATGVYLPSGPYDTVAGYLLAQLGRLPEVGDGVDMPGEQEADLVRLQVAAMDGRRIALIAVSRPSDAEPAGDAVDCPHVDGSADRWAANG